MDLLKQDDAMMAREAGYNNPVRLSVGVKEIIKKAVSDPDWCNDWNGVLWDILCMSLSPAICKQMDSDPTSATFSVIVTGVNSLRPGEADIEAHLIPLVSTCGPMAIGDPATCFTILTSEEYHSRRPFEYFKQIGYFKRLEQSMN